MGWHSGEKGYFLDGPEFLGSVCEEAVCSLFTAFA